MNFAQIVALVYGRVGLSLLVHGHFCDLLFMRLQGKILVEVRKVLIRSEG